MLEMTECFTTMGMAGIWSGRLKTRYIRYCPVSYTHLLTRDYGLSEAEAKRIGEEMFDNEIWVQGLDGGRLSLEEAIHQYELKYPDDVDVMGWFLRNGEQMAVKRPEVWDCLLYTSRCV